MESSADHPGTNADRLVIGRKTWYMLRNERWMHVHHLVWISILCFCSDLLYLSLYSSSLMF